MGPEEIDSAIERGKLYKEFKNTLYYEDLKAWADSEIEKGKDLVMQYTLSQDYEKAKAEGHRVSGVQAFLNRIENSISEMGDATRERDAEKDYKDRIPTHVRSR